MEENKKAAEQKPVKKDDKEKFSFKSWFTAIKSEFKKVIWPSRKDLVRDTITVIVTSAFFGLLIVGLDTVFAIGYKFLVSLF